MFDSIDEICPWLLFMLFLFSKKKISKSFLIFIGICIFYLLYSIIIRSNVLNAIFFDFIIETKPYLTFFSVLCLRPKFSIEQINLLKKISLFCLPVLLLIGLLHYGREQTTKGEILAGARFASACVTIALSYYLFAKKDGVKTMVICMLICSIGLLIPTSKYIGECACIIFLFYSIGRKRRVWNQIFIVLFFIVISYVVYDVIQDDINLYFLTDDVARNALFITSFSILNDYIPFGSGFGSFANSASAIWYSPLYTKYGLDSVFGLAKGEANFVSDTFFPVLAQFGYAGVLLFFSFLQYIYKSAKLYYRYRGNLKSYKVSLIVLISIIIESTADATFIGNRGVGMMLILALSLYDIKDNTTSKIKSLYYNDLDVPLR